MAFVLRLLLAWFSVLPAVGAELQELRAASVTSTVDGVVEQSQAALPYYWDRLHSNHSGTAVFEIPFALPAGAGGPYGLSLKRIGNTAEIWLNGFLLSRYGDLATADAADYAKTPQFVLIPAQLLQRDNLLRISIHADGGRRGGLSEIVVGPESEVRAVYTNAYRWRVSSSGVIAMFSLVVGVMALVLWLTQSDQGPAGGVRRDGIYLSAALAELFWAERLSEVFLSHPPLAWPWWGMLQNFAYASWICCVTLFCHQVAGWHRHASMPWVSAFLWALLLSSAPVVYLGVIRHQELYLTAWFGVASMALSAYGLFYFWAALRQPSTQRLIMVIAFMLNVVAGARDWLVIRLSDDLDFVSWIRFSSVAFGLALGYIVLSRFRAASGLARDLMANMAAKVAEKEQALAASYLQMEQLARAQERTAERTSILRDMHDGVGAHISSAIRQLQSGKASNAQLLQTLRDSLDQLKLSIDAIHLPPGDITALLANLRYRLEPRLKDSDIALQWEVDQLPPLERLDDKAMRQLQFMVFEALSNVLQHAQASVLRIELRSTPARGARLRVIDNGCGFDPERVKRTGLSTLRERATAINAALVIVSAAGQTVVEIGLD